MAYKKPASLDHWTEFTKRIYNEWDADPGYYALGRTDIPHAQKLRFAVAWCTYYNLGIAADASEKQGKRFWDYLLDCYGTAKRATERRHFRGAAGLIAIDQWRTRWPKPEALSEFMCVPPDFNITYFDIRRQGQQVAQYGDYFYWKWCDLHEVLEYGPVSMLCSERYSPKVPQQGAKLIHDMDQDDRREWKHVPVDDRDYGEYPDCVVPLTYAEIAGWGRKHKIPPRTTDSRPFDIQEAETVCCVYKQMAGGSYTYGTRTAKALRRLRAGKSRTAAAMCATLLDLSPYTEAELNRALDSLTE